MPSQLYNDQNIDLLAGVFQRRSEANFSMAQAASLMQLMPDVRGVWPFSGVEGSALVDISGQGRNMLISGPTLGTFGLVQYGVFDGVNDYCTRPDEVGLSVTGGLSFGGWFYFGANGAVQGMISKWLEAGNQRSYFLDREIANTITAGVSVDGATGVYATSAAVTISAWHFCALRFEPSTMLSVFVDGVWVDNAVGVPAAIYDGTENLEIGRLNQTNYLTGRAALCWLAAKSLPKAEIDVLFGATRALFKV